MQALRGKPPAAAAYALTDTVCQVLEALPRHLKTWSCLSPSLSCSGGWWCTGRGRHVSDIVSRSCREGHVRKKRGAMNGAAVGEERAGWLAAGQLGLAAGGVGVCC
jgi:hypothetical protein